MSAIIPHPSYTGMLAQWNACRDFMQGQEAVKAKGKAYLPDLNMPALYERYKEYAVVLEVVPRTIGAYLGLIYRRDPQVVLPASLKYLEDDADAGGISLYSKVKSLVTDVINPSRAGILVDLPAEGGQPYITSYAAEDIVFWREGKLPNGRRTLLQVVLRETSETSTGEAWSVTTEEKYRVWELIDGVAQVRILDKEGRELSRMTPTRRGKRGLDRIPFVFLNPGSLSPTIHRPLMMGLVNLNKSHYKSYADLEWSRHYVACPQPYACGFDIPADGKLTFGASQVWISSQPTARAGFLERPPLEGLERALATKESQMISMGASMIIEGARPVETAEAARIHQGSKTSILHNVVTSVSDGITRALHFADYWLGKDSSEASYELNTEFFESKMDTAELSALVAAWQSGAISHETLLSNLQKREVLPADRTIDEELAATQAETEKLLENTPPQNPQNEEGTPGPGAE